MPRFNIALLIKDKATSQSITEYAQSNFRSLADDYLLGAKALPHITISQFYAESADIAKEAFTSWKNEPLEIQLCYLYIAPCTNDHDNKVWVGLMVKPDTRLLIMQRNCCTHIQMYGLSSLTSVGTYRPHVTLARLSEWPLTALSSPECIPLMSPIEVSVALGQCSEAGVFLERLL